MHRHKWVRSPRGMSENPGVWDTGSGSILYRSACGCGACRREVASYCGRGGDSIRIIMPGEHGYSIIDVQHARGAGDDEE